MSSYPSTTISQSSQVSEPGPSYGKSGPRVLLIEDTPSNQRVMAVLVERFGLPYDVADTATEGLAKYQQHRHPIILLDIRLPDLDGTELTALLRSLAGDGKAPYIIAQTAYALPGQREEFLAAGMDDYLAKPISLSTFDAAITRAVQVVQQRQAAQ